MVPIHAILECRRCASWQILARLGVVGLEAQTHLWKFNVLVEVHTETVQSFRFSWSSGASCEGAWRHSEFFLQIRQKNRHRQFGITSVDDKEWTRCKVWVSRNCHSNHRSKGAWRRCVSEPDSCASRYAWGDDRGQTSHIIIHNT